MPNRSWQDKIRGHLRYVHKLNTAEIDIAVKDSVRVVIGETEKDGEVRVM